MSITVTPGLDTCHPTSPTTSIPDFLDRFGILTKNQETALSSSTFITTVPGSELHCQMRRLAMPLMPPKVSQSIVNPQFSYPSPSSYLLVLLESQTEFRSCPLCDSCILLKFYRLFSRSYKDPWSFHELCPPRESSLSKTARHPKSQLVGHQLLISGPYLLIQVLYRL